MATDELKLQRYFDGELDPEERTLLEKELTDLDHQKLAAMGELRDVLTRALDAEAADIDLLPGLEKGLKQARVRRWRERLRGRRLPTSVGLVAAALASLVLVLSPWRGGLPTNECDVEDLEVEGALATVLRLDDAQHGRGATATVIWMEDD